MQARGSHWGRRPPNQPPPWITSTAGCRVPCVGRNASIDRATPPATAYCMVRSVAPPQVWEAAEVGIGATSTTRAAAASTADIWTRRGTEGDSIGDPLYRDPG